MSSPSWKTANLQRHYQEHPVAECACWEKLTGVQPGPIPIQKYESESLSVMQNSWLTFRADRQAELDSEPNRVEYFCDVRKCLTAVHMQSDTIKTCFHVHIAGQCDIPAPLTGKRQLLQYWTKKKSASDGRISNPNVVRYSVTHEERKYLGTYLSEFISPSRTRGGGK